MHKCFVVLLVWSGCFCLAYGQDTDPTPGKTRATGPSLNSNQQTEANPADPPANRQTKKLTAEEVANLFAEDIGKWKITGKSTGRGGAPEPFEDVIEIRWKVKGKSTAASFNPLINNVRVPFVGHKEYDAKEGVFLWRSKGEGFPEVISREQYDRATKTYRGTSTFPDGAKETSKFKVVSKDKRLFKSQVEIDGEVVFSREAIFTRMAETVD